MGDTLASKNARLRPRNAPPLWGGDSEADVFTFAICLFVLAFVGDFRDVETGSDDVTSSLIFAGVFIVAGILVILFGETKEIIFDKNKRTITYHKHRLVGTGKEKTFSMDNAEKITWYRPKFSKKPSPGCYFSFWFQDGESLYLGMAGSSSPPFIRDIAEFLDVPIEEGGLFSMIKSAFSQ